MNTEKTFDRKVVAKVGPPSKISAFERNLKWFVHDHCVGLGLLFFLAGIVGTFLLYTNGINWQLFIAIFGGLFSFVFLLQKQQLEEARFANDLINRFNERYDLLNEPLNRIYRESGMISEKDISTLYDYFNLCGEEYVFYLKGYIYPQVWDSWTNGMKHFATRERIAELWRRELVDGSYYGLQFDSTFCSRVTDIRKELRLSDPSHEKGKSIAS